MPPTASEGIQDRDVTEDSIRMAPPRFDSLSPPYRLPAPCPRVRAGVIGWGWHPPGPRWEARSGRHEAQLGPPDAVDHRGWAALDGTHALDGAEAAQELLEHHPALEASEGSPQAEVVPLPEGEMGVGVPIDLEDTGA